MIIHLASVFLMVKFSLKNGNPILQLLIKLLSNFTLLPLFSIFHILFPLPHLLCASVVGNKSQHNSHNTAQSNLCTYFIP